MRRLATVNMIEDFNPFIEIQTENLPQGGTYYHMQGLKQVHYMKEELISIIKRLGNDIKGRTLILHFEDEIGEEITK
jgi:hypothetical protein